MVQKGVPVTLISASSPSREPQFCVCTCVRASRGRFAATAMRGADAARRRQPQRCHRVTGKEVAMSPRKRYVKAA